MKSSMLVCLCFVLMGLTVSVKAQTDLKYGVTAGLNFSTLNGKDAAVLGSNLSSKNGLYIGGFLNYPFSDMFALQPELAFTMKGANNSGGGVTETWSFNYLEIPVLVKYYVPISGSTNIKPDLYAGPAFAFNIAASDEVSQGSQTLTTDIKDQTKGFDLGLAFGGGVGFNVGNSLLDFSLRYTLGLTSTDNSGNNYTITNGVFAIVAGYTF